MDTIKLLHYTLKDEDLKSLATSIQSARKVRCVGEINSEVTCLQLKYALAMYGIDVDVLPGTANVKAIDLITNEQDLLIVISASADSHIVKTAFDLKENTGCQIALVTMNPSTSLETARLVIFICKCLSSLKLSKSRYDCKSRENRE